MGELPFARERELPRYLMMKILSISRLVWRAEDKSWACFLDHLKIQARFYRPLASWIDFPVI